MKSATIIDFAAYLHQKKISTLNNDVKTPGSDELSIALQTLIEDLRNASSERDTTHINKRAWQ